MRPILAATAFVLTAAAVAAQNTLIVDSRGGPGVFLDLAPAVAAASPGDTIVVRYTYFSPQVFHGAVIDKPLKVIGVFSQGGPAASPAPVPFQDRIEVLDIPAGSEVLLANMIFRGRLDSNPPNAPIPHGVVVKNCAGRVHLEAVHYHSYHFDGGGVSFTDCADLSLHQCEMRQAGQSILFRRSNAAIAECSFPIDYPLSVPVAYHIDTTAAALRLEDSTVRIVDAVIDGADSRASMSHGLLPARPAAELVNGTLWIGTNAVLHGGADLGVRTFAVTGTGSVIQDPYSVHTGIQAGVAVRNQRLAAVYAGRVIQNQPFQVVVTGPPNGCALLAIGTALPQGLALPFGTLVLDPASLLLLSVAALGPWGAVQQQFTMPAAAPIDIVFALQAATLDPGGGVGITWPWVFSIAWDGLRPWP